MLLCYCACVELNPFGVTIGIEATFVFVFGFGADTRGVNFHFEDSSSTRPTVEHDASCAVVKVEQGRDKVEIGRADSFAVTLYLHYLTATEPAQRVNGMDAIIQHVVTRFEIGLWLAFEERTLGMDNRPTFATLVV